METEHIEGASKMTVEVGEGNNCNDGSGDDQKARVIGQSRCRAARRLARWAVTADDIQQQDKGNTVPHGGNTTTTETEVLLPTLLDCGQGKNPPHQNEVVSQQKKGDSNEGVASDRIRENGDRVKNVSNNNNGGMQEEAYHTTDSTNNREGDARETTTIEKSTHGTQNPNLNKERIPPSDTSLPQHGDQLPESK
jgi:hypothetical protein